jgi:5,6,7,8-tetrahydromethanopterin hydro-lyase
VVDAVREGIIPQDQVENICIIVGVFIHWDASDDQKIFDWNREATKQSIARAMGGEPTAQQVIDGEAQARHPFAAGAEA